MHSVKQITTIYASGDSYMRGIWSPELKLFILWMRTFWSRLNASQCEKRHLSPCCMTQGFYKRKIRETVHNRFDRKIYWSICDPSKPNVRTSFYHATWSFISLTDPKRSESKYTHIYYLWAHLSATPSAFIWPVSSLSVKNQVPVVGMLPKYSEVYSRLLQVNTSS